MVKGIGIDIVSIRRMARRLASPTTGPAFLTHTFTQAERDAAPGRAGLQAAYYAARFAGKEAVYKAVAHLLPQHAFDMRIVETLNAADGCPYVSRTAALDKLLKDAGVAGLEISISTEGDNAVAMVVAESGR